MSAWTRRSKAMTGAEWIQTRFGRATGANLAHLSVVLFAVVNVIGLLAYAFKGIGKFAVVMLPGASPARPRDSSAMRTSMPSSSWG